MRLGANLIMPLDECLGPEATRTEAEGALDRTQRWWRRSLAAHRRDDQALFVLIQGGLFPDLRREAARAAAGEPAPGFAIGGLSVGEPKEVTAALLHATLAELPPDRPRYLMGIGHPKDLVDYARLGVDLFDCVLPTRLGRSGAVWSDVEGNRLNLSRRALLERTCPIMAGCVCFACTGWSVGSLAALFQSREPLAHRLASSTISPSLARWRLNCDRQSFTLRRFLWHRKLTIGDDHGFREGDANRRRSGCCSHRGKRWSAIPSGCAG